MGLALGAGVVSNSVPSALEGEPVASNGENTAPLSSHSRISSGEIPGEGMELFTACWVKESGVQLERRQVLVHKGRAEGFRRKKYLDD
jgi:hypothetical protein